MVGWFRYLWAGFLFLPFRRVVLLRWMVPPEGWRCLGPRCWCAERVWWRLYRVRWGRVDWRRGMFLWED